MERGSTFAFDDAVDKTHHPTLVSRVAAGAEATDDRREYAFVQMAYDPPGQPTRYLWRSLAMARALQRLSRFNMILLTNTTHLTGDLHVWELLQKLNVEVLPILEVPLRDSVRSRLKPAWQVAYWKIQIWRLTQFKRLIWLDSDAILYRGIDWLFQRGPVLGQSNEQTCEGIMSDEEIWCSGLMLIEPSTQVYEGLVQLAGHYSDWTENGDQKLIFDYFKLVARRPARVVGPMEATFGKCLQPGVHLPALQYKASAGPWTMPAFVHRSSANNECFDYDAGKQLVNVEGKTVNICHFHPLGAYWRDLFCEAIQILGVFGATMARFCDDAEWYRGGS